MNDKLGTDIKYLKGVGEKRAALLAKLDVHTVGDLLQFYPRDYIDITSPGKIADAAPGEISTVLLTVLSKSGEQRIRKGMSIFKVTAADDDGDVMSVTFFNVKYLVDSLKVGEEYIFYGRTGGNFLKREMTSPAVFKPEAGERLIPVYPATAGITPRAISGLVRRALDDFAEFVPDFLPRAVREREELCHTAFALENIHFPVDIKHAETAKKRLVFEELFYLALALDSLKKSVGNEKFRRFEFTDLSEFYRKLPFEPTGAQRRACEDIVKDLGVKRMNRLIEGDVGSGKTMVAAAAAYLAYKNGGQTAVLVPTEILAEQHLGAFTRFLEPFGIKTGLLTGKLKTKEKNDIKKALENGEIDVIVGTHALISQGIKFSDPVLTVTDEQHRFGVKQRGALSLKGEHPHVLAMSATPIPRTLSLIVHGDLDLTVIDELPAGRKPVETVCIDSGKKLRALGFIKEHLEKGLGAYIVCPLVEQGEQEINAVSATEYFQELSEGFFKDFRVGLLHGRMKPAQKEEVMRGFKNGEISLLIATTVIEVGVDVPNAVVMLVENAERFGLSALHQLRGRVGRGSEKSYCILVSDSRGETARARLSALKGTSDGFKIAEIDLKLRGPGDFLGSRQHGLPRFKIADISRDAEIFSRAAVAARAVADKKIPITPEEELTLRRKTAELFREIGETPN